MTRTVLTLLRALIVSALVATAIVVPVTAAQADGTPNVTLARTVAASTLYGKDVSVMLTATQSSGTAGYNLTFTDILPAGATLTSSSYAVTASYPLANGSTQVIFGNVADLASGSTVGLDYTFSYPTGTYDIGTVFTGTAGAYVNSDPRMLPKFTLAAGVVTPSAFTGSATATSATTLVPFIVEKKEPSPEHELVRGVHDHKTSYTVTITNNTVKPTTDVSLTDYLPAGLEYLGCVNVDNSADVEYPGSGRIDDTPLPPVVAPAQCVAQDSAVTVTTDPDGSGPLPTAVYTKVDWLTLPQLAANGSYTVAYAAAVPLRENVASSAPDATANLDNNTGALTTDEQALPNHAIAFGQTGGKPYSAADTLTVTAEDVAIQKSVTEKTFVQGSLSHWKFDVEVSEYARSTGPITVVDTLPDGLDFTSSVPTNDSVVPNSDGTVTVTWVLDPFAAKNGTATITMVTTTRDKYRVIHGAGPVSANDSWTNAVHLATDATVITANAGTTSVLPIIDDSSVGQEAGGLGIRKEIAAPAPVATNCGDGTGRSFHTTVQGDFHPGDLVCYRLTVDFPGALDTLGTRVADFLPAGYEYVGSAATSASTISSDPVVVSGRRVAWNLIDDAVEGADQKFQVVLTARIADSTAVESGDLTSNLMKMTYRNSEGKVFQARTSADATITKPVLALDKAVTKVNGTAPTAQPVRVFGTDTVEYTVTLTNSGGQDAVNTNVWDTLPALIDCSDVTVAADCTNGRIWWTALTVPANGTKVLTYTVTIPATLSPDDLLHNVAGVTTYQGETNDGLSYTYVPANNVDPSTDPATVNAPAANDTADVQVTSPKLLKTQTTGVTESGNNADTQAAIGEVATYSVATTLPHGTTLYGSPAITDVVNANLQIVGTPTSTLGTLAVSGNTITITLPATVDVSDTTDQIVTLEYSARVKDASGPKRGNQLPNSATLAWKNAANTAGSAKSNTTNLTIVEPNLSLVKTNDAPSGSTTPGAKVIYTVTVANGNQANVSVAHDITVVDTLPADVDPLDAADAVVTSNATLPSGGVYNAAQRTITFTVADLARNSNSIISYATRVKNPLVSGSSITNSAIARTSSLAGTNANERDSTSALGGPGSGYQATATSTLTTPGLSLTKSVTPTQLTIGEVATYTVDVTIPANVTSFDTTVQDTLPATMTFGALTGTVTCLQGGAPCPTPVTVAAQPVTGAVVPFSLGDIAPSSTARTVTFSYTATVGSAAKDGDALINSALPRWNSTNRNDGTFQFAGAPATATVTVKEPHIVIGKTVSGQVAGSTPPRATPGQSLTYDVTVTNDGDWPAWDVSVADTPDHRVSSFSSTLPAGVTATDVDPSDGTLGWTIPGPLAAGASITISYSVHMPALTSADEVSGPEINNTADVTSYKGIDPALPQTGKTYTDVPPASVGVELDLASIGNHVWFDSNGDGLDNDDEPGLAGIGVTVIFAGVDGILGTADDENHPTTTDAAGDYLVTNLPGGLFRVTIDPSTLPAGVTASYDRDGIGSPNVWSGTLGESQDKRDVDFGYTGIGSIGDQLWFDQDGDGAKGTGEPGIPGATVTVVWAGPDGDLANTADNVTYTTTTASDGTYTVSKLPAGPYTVTVSGMPNGYSVTHDPAGGTSSSSTTDLTAGQKRIDQDFGIAGTGSIGDFVWLDRDGDSAQDAGEPGVFGATVDLTWLGVDGAVGGGDDATFTTTTGVDGQYLFTNLLPGNYVVAVTGGLPAAATNSYDLDGDKNSSTSVGLEIGQNRTDVDFGYKVVSIIGQTVWWDLNKDGAQQANEPGIPNVGITVTYLGPDGILGTGDDLVFTTKTDADGNWSVSDIPDGDFVVQVTSGVPAGFAPTYDADSGTVDPDGKSAVTVTGSDLNQNFGYAGDSSIGDTVWYDLDGDGTQTTGEPGIADATVTLVWFGPDGVKGGGDDVTFTTTTDADGKYLFDGLPAGEYGVSVTPPASVTALEATYDLDGGKDSTTRVTLPAATALDTVDFGLRGTGSIGDTVWLDQNANGTRETGEPGLAGATVTLVWAGLDGDLGTADDVTSTTTTDSTGAYLFEHLLGGQYSVTVSGLPAGLSQTADPDGGADSVSALTLADGGTDLAQDFGYVGTAAVGDLLWLDVDGDGTQGATEPGLAGVPVTVRHPGADGVLGTADDIVVVQKTDSTGHYHVDGLPAGDVVVSYRPSDLVAGLVPSSDLDGGDLASATVTLATGETRDDLDFVVVGSATLHGNVYDDANGNGVRDPGEVGIPGVGVVIVWHADAGDVTVHATTDSQGNWSLTTLPAGTYTVTIDPATFPTGFRPTTSTSSIVTLSAFGTAEVVDGLTTLALAFTGGPGGLAMLLALLLLALGLFGFGFARIRRFRRPRHTA